MAEVSKLLPIDPVLFANDSPYDVVDKGTEGTLDPEDIVRRDGQLVDWTDGTFKDARLAFVQKHVVVPAAEHLQKLDFLTAPGCAKTDDLKQALAKAETLFGALEAIAANEETPEKARAEARLILSGLQGKVAEDGNDGSLGKESFSNLRAARRDDYPFAWCVYATALLKMSKHPMKLFIQAPFVGLGININRELRGAIKRLASSGFKDSVDAHIYLEHVLSDLEANGHANEADKMVLKNARTRLARWAKTDEDKAKHIEEVRANLAKRSDVESEEEPQCP